MTSHARQIPKLKNASQLLALMLVIGLLLASACTVPPLQTPLSTTSAPPTDTPLLPTTPPAASPSSTPTSPGPVTLHLWVPPEMDPNAETPVGTLLKTRLEEFSNRRPGVRVEARVKALEGPGGLLDTLTSASAAAPLALPDLIALPHPLMEAAAIKGLLHPYDGLTTAMLDPDWYDYARYLARLQNSTFGLPFAGDALVVVHRPARVAAPVDWAAALQVSTPLVFPAADPQALFTLAQYQANGGLVRDEQGRPTLDPALLGDVLTFYSEAEQADIMPFWLTQYTSDQQGWDTFLEARSDLVVTWASRHLANIQADTTLAPLPTQNGTPYTLATGWVWALATPQPDRQELSTNLAEFLTESDFLAEWDKALGFLPPRPSGLSTLADPALQSVLTTVSTTAQGYPPTDVLASLGPAISNAAVQVLKEQADPSTAARNAAESLSQVKNIP